MCNRYFIISILYTNYLDLIQPPVPSPTDPFFTTSLLPPFLSFLRGPLCLMTVACMSVDVGRLSVWAAHEWLQHWGNYSPLPSNPLTANSLSRRRWVSISISPTKMDIKGGIAEGDKEFFALGGFLWACLFVYLFVVLEQNTDTLWQRAWFLVITSSETRWFTSELLHPWWWIH